MKRILTIIMMLLPVICYGQFATSIIYNCGTSDSIGVDVDGGAFDSYLYPAYLREGSNITFTVAGDTLTVAGSAGSGSVDTIYIHDGSTYYDNIADQLRIKEGSGLDIQREDSTSYDVIRLVVSLGTDISWSELTSAVQDSFGVLLDTASIKDSLDVLRGEFMASANLGNFIDTITTDTIPHANFADSSGKIDTTYTPFTTYVANHGGAGSTNADSIQHYLVTTVNPTDGKGLIYESDSSKYIMADFWDTPDTAGHDDHAMFLDVPGDSVYWADPTGTVDSTEFNDTQVKEYIDDNVGGMVTGNTETRITVTYQDGDGTIDFVVDDMNDDIPEAGDYTNLTGGNGIDHSVTGTIYIDTAAVANGESKPASGNQIYDWGVGVFETITNVALIGDDTTAFKTAHDSTTAWDNRGYPDATVSVQGIASFADANFTVTAGEVTIDDDYLLNNGDAGTGVYDFGGATSVEIPNDNNPTTDAEGEIAWDANDDAIEIYSGDEGESVLIPIYRTISLLISQPDSIQTYSDSLCIFHADALMYPFGVEIDQLSITLEADAAYMVKFQEWSSADPPVYQNLTDSVYTTASDTYGEDGTIQDGNLDVDERLYMVLPTTDVPSVFINIIYHVNDGN